MRLVICIILFCFAFQSKAQETDTTHSPRRAAMLSLAVPGAGQIYNNAHRPEGKKSQLWWKLPAIWGGLGASAYLGVAYHKEFKFNLNERIELAAGTDKPFTDAQYEENQETYRQWRDNSIVAFVVLYALNAADASVQGHLLHFDSSNDLSFDLEPSYRFDQHGGFSAMTLKIRF